MWNVKLKWLSYKLQMNVYMHSSEIKENETWMIWRVVVTSVGTYFWKRSQCNEPINCIFLVHCNHFVGMRSFEIHRQYWLTVRNGCPLENICLKSFLNKNQYINKYCYIISFYIREKRAMAMDDFDIYCLNVLGIFVYVCLKIFFSEMVIVKGESELWQPQKSPQFLQGASTNSSLCMKIELFLQNTKVHGGPSDFSTLYFSLE